jgi:hypothetical protein
MSGYDSRPDTIKHIRRVQTMLVLATQNLGQRAAKHDLSKLESPEKEIFDEVTPRLKELTYGSDEYKSCLAYMGEALRHHYDHNSHHPEHYPDGIRGMSLFDVLEMLIDWKAASERHANGNIWTSIEQNQERFGYSDDLMVILTKTALEMGWE